MGPQVVVDDGQVFVLVRGAVVDDQAEAVGQGDGLVHAVVAVDVVGATLAVVPGFLDQVAAVRGGVDQDVFGAGFDAAFDGGFQVFVFRLGVLEREVVEVQDEMLRGESAKRLHDARQLRELGLRDLHETQPIEKYSFANALTDEDLPVPRAPTSSTLFAGRPARNAKVLLCSSFFWLM